MSLMSNEANKQSTKPFTKEEKKSIFGDEKSNEESKQAESKGLWK